MNKGFKKVFLLAIVACLAVIVLSLGCSDNRSSRQTTQGESGQAEQRAKISGMDGQSTRKDEGSVAHPGEGRTIHGLDDLDVNSDK